MTTYALMSLLVGCGGRTAVFGGGRDVPSEYTVVELCNGIDDDADQKVDEDFRNADALYVDDDNCGSCGHACNETFAHTAAVGCGLIDGTPACVAVGCEEGFSVSRNGRCVDVAERLCMPCKTDDDCGSLASARCIGTGNDSYCTVSCDAGCPGGYTCELEKGYCFPQSGDCRCDVGESFTAACDTTAPNGETCSGHQRCDDGSLSACAVDDEVCDGMDNDCDGTIDEGFVDVRGAYSVDIANCGRCGVDCRTDADAGVPLICGGDPFAPTCVVSCPDAADGVQLGDHLDADHEISTGCECTVTKLTDETGETSSDALDANCDGADGSVLTSYYVATDGDDLGPGSPTLPLHSISRAVQLAIGTLGSDAPRTDIYVASGTYTELVRVGDGVAIHGGYRRDFRERNPDGFEVIVVAPTDAAGIHGAALEISYAGYTPTLVEGLHVRGADATDSGEPAVAVYVQEPGTSLTLRDLRVHSGHAAIGGNGTSGSSGKGPSKKATAGAAQRASLEDTNHICLVGTMNISPGGSGGVGACEIETVNGGKGASPVCPLYRSLAPSGEPGMGANAGDGGLGGLDVQGPIDGGGSCPGAICCGLADFYVPGAFPEASPGGDGANGIDGVAGLACDDPLGNFSGDTWLPGTASPGSWGSPGGGGGGGGAGGGVEMIWYDMLCQYKDGIGGAGGGGGAGGCGGIGGTEGEAAAPSIGVFVQSSSNSRVPRIEDSNIESADGSHGGDGGAGGDGAAGGNGASGGALPREMLSIPTLAGAAPGARGGHGGQGGAGGGGGGGCGGSSVGIWITGFGGDPLLAARLRADNAIAAGVGGNPGRGGSGAVPADNGKEGVARDVVVR